MTKEEVLQRANEYCNERSYDSATLTDDFKDKFADFFSQKYPDVDITDENALKDLKFNLDTARSAAAKGIAGSQKSFETKENDYKNQIAELQKKIGKQPQVIQQNELPQEVKEAIAELKTLREEKTKQEKFKEIVTLAKKGIRNDLHSSFDAFVKDFVVNPETSSEEQAKKVTERFQEVFRESIGDIKPLAPKVVQQREDAALESIPTVTIK